ncbi:hypothetical protein [uncultured Fibrobacter sp.]|uniref:hypothetical protein n=1 Tax=uncultured Fibrobacter sp. TaxID=261512 RepID=UPI002805E456|nr:hypothetical protein [uncultured Fibrobacter sp.]
MPSKQEFFEIRISHEHFYSGKEVFLRVGSAAFTNKNALFRTVSFHGKEGRTEWQSPPPFLLQPDGYNILPAAAGGNTFLRRHHFLREIYFLDNIVQHFVASRVPPDEHDKDDFFRSVHSSQNLAFIGC